MLEVFLVLALLLSCVENRWTWKNNVLLESNQTLALCKQCRQLQRSQLCSVDKLRGSPSEFGTSCESKFRILPRHAHDPPMKRARPLKRFRRKRISKGQYAWSFGLTYSRTVTLWTASLTYKALSSIKSIRKVLRAAAGGRRSVQ